MNVYELYAKLGLDATEYEAGLDKAKQGSTTFGQVLKANLVTKGIELVTKGLVKASQAALAFAKASVQTGAEFDSAMSQVAATMGTTVDQIGDLRDFAQDMGAKTAFSATQAAEALNYMALAGYDAETSMAMLPNVLNLAAAGGFDLARASDMVTDAQSALGLTLPETNRMVDQMAAAASKSNTSVEQLGDAFLTIGATARNLKGGTEELSTVLGVLADNGIKGAEGGTHLRNMILSLQSPTSDALKILDQMNISLYDGQGEMRSMIDIIGDLQTGLEGMDQASKDAVIGGIFNKTDLAAVNALVGTSRERFDELTSAIRNSSGAAEDMANTQLDNLNGDITLMQSALEGVKIQFSDGITPAIRNVVQTVTKALSKRSTMKYINELGQKLGELTKTLTGKVMNALPRVLSLFDDGGKKAKVAAGAVTMLAIALEATVNPAAALTHGLALAVGVLGMAALTADDARTRFGKLTESQRDDIDAALDAVDAYQELKDSHNETISGIAQETQRTRELWQELQSLTDENGNVAESDREHASVIIDQLNEALGTEIELVNGQIQGYDSLASSIDNVIAKKQAEAMLSAVQESADQAKKNLQGYSDALYAQGVELDNLNASLDFYNQKLDETRASESLSYDDKQQLIEQYNNQIAALQQSVDASQAEYERLSAAERDAYADMQLAQEAYTAFLEGDYNKVSELIQNDTINRIQHSIEAGKVSAQEIADLQKQYATLEAEIQRYQENLLSGAKGYSQEELDAMTQHRDEVLKTLDAAKEQFEAQAESINNTPAKVDVDDNSDEVVENLRGVEQKRDQLKNTHGTIYVDVVVNDPKGVLSSSGYNRAIGQDYVPYDNFPAMLHRGEAVLTAREAEAWRRGESAGGGNVTINQYLETKPQSPVEVASATAAYFEQARWALA